MNNQPLAKESESPKDAPLASRGERDVFGPAAEAGGVASRLPLGEASGDFFSGMIFSSYGGMEKWGTRAVSGELPAGIDAAQVEELTIAGGLLEKIKPQLTGLSEDQKRGLTHLVGWRTRQAGADGLGSAEIEQTTRSEKPPLIESPIGEITFDRDIVDGASPTPEAPHETSVPPDNLAAVSAQRVTPGLSVEDLMRRIKARGAKSPAELSAEAQAAHNLARTNRATEG